MVKKPRRGFFPQGLGELVRLKDKVVFITGASGEWDVPFAKPFSVKVQGVRHRLFRRAGQRCNG
jgi:hypothetical protein